MVKNKDCFRALPIKERAALINKYVSGGIMDLAEMKRHYNSFSPGGPIETDEYGYPADIAPAVIEADYPRENEVWKRADASNADMIQRLKQGSSRVTIQDWEDPRRVATHKMMSAGKYAVGNVQNINGQLFDFTDPKHGFEDSDRAAIDSAIRRGDYIEFDTEGDARYFAEHYKKHYNSFGSGGDTDGDGNIVLDWIRKQLYDKIDPVGYDYFVDRVKAAVLGKGEDRYNKARDDIFATYLKIPKDERHNVESAKKVSDATYTPTKNSEDSTYHKIDLTDKEKDALIYDALRSNANVGDNSSSHVFEQFFGPHQVSRGKDEKGEYVSYYDLWDLDPSSGESKTGEFEFLKSLQKLLGAKDISLGIGEPVEFYDRIYLNDYFGVTPQIDEGVIEGGYIQPAYIEASAGTSSTLTGEDYYDAGETYLPTYSKGGKLNKFGGGGPTREMTTSEAKAINKTLNKSQYMLAVGDSPDSPAYLSTDELQPAIVIAERKNPTSEDIEKEKRDFAKKIRGRSLVGHIGGVGPTLGDTSLSDIAATAIGIPLFMTNPVGQALLNTTLKTYNTPGIKQAADTYFTYEGLNNLISDNGIKKTANLFKNKEYAKGVKSAIGDIMDAAGPVFLMDDLYKLGKEGVRLGKWMTRSANDVLNINTSEDALNAAVNNYRKYINPTADISNYDVRFVENLPKDTWGGLYFPDTKRINIKTRDNKVDEMTSLIHEMRHQDDPFLHKKRQTFTLDSSSRPTGRLQLDNGQIETLNAAYGDVKNTLEHITTNTDLRSILELQYIKETGKIPTVNQLNTYIEKLSPFSLGLAKAGANGYTANTIFPSLFNTDYIKDALMFVRKDGGAINRFDIGGDKDPWYKRLYNWVFNDTNTEETTPQENKYLTNDNYLDEVSKFISTFEEFYPNAYEDTHNGKNIWTVGSGLTYFLDDEGNEIKVKKGDTITKEENINQLNKRLQKNIDYVKSKTQYWDNYPAELKFQLLDAMYNIGASKVWNPETNYIKAIMQYENEKGWENPEYDLKNIFQHADWNLNNKGWLGIRSRMRRNPQSINVEDFSKIYQNDYRDSLRTAYDLKFQNN